MTFNTENLKVTHIVPALSIKFNESANILIGVAKNPEYRIVTA